MWIEQQMQWCFAQLPLKNSTTTKLAETKSKSQTESNFSFSWFFFCSGLKSTKKPGIFHFDWHQMYCSHLFFNVDLKSCSAAVAAAADDRREYRMFSTKLNIATIGMQF